MNTEVMNEEAAETKRRSYIKPRLESAESLLQRPRVFLTDAPIILGISRSTILRRVKDGALPALSKDGKLNYWPTKVILEHVAYQDSQPTLA